MQAPLRWTAATWILRLLGLIGPLVFIGSFGLLNHLQPPFPGRDSLSAYALGSYGWLMNAAFIAAGMGFLALAGVLARSVKDSRWKMAGSIFLALAGIGWILLGVGNTDNTPSPTTATGWIHAAGFVIGFPSLIISPFAWSRAFRRDSDWRSAARWSTVAALAVLAAFLLTPLLQAASFLAAVVLLVSWAAAMALRSLTITANGQER